MLENIIKIELQSDLCSSSGESLNTQLDIDVCYDEYGLPYIPGKRIKGLLRESAQELVDINLIDQPMINLIFGEADNKPGCASFGSAVLEDIKSWQTALDFLDTQKFTVLEENVEQQDILSILSDVTHPQSVLSQFTSERTQTRINEYGVAEDGSLRTMRVVNSGLIFCAPIYCHVEKTKDATSVKTKIEEEILNALKLSMLNLRYMGVNRTRGLGKVNCSLASEKWKEIKIDNINEHIISNEQDRSVLNYSLYLKNPCILQSSDGRDTESDIFIEGSRIMGICLAEARRSNKELFAEIINDASLKFSFAYISDGKKRFLPLPLSLVKVKDAQNEHEDQVYNLVYQANAEQKTAQDSWRQKQLSGIDSVFFNGGITNKENNIPTLSVDKQINYHNRRSENKSLGRAEGEGFYQLESIAAGQYFAGQIYGPKALLEKIDQLLENKNLKLGASKTSEYGGVTYRKISLGKLETINSSTKAKEYVVLLHSPLIMYNDQAMPNADPEVLKKYLEQALRINVDEDDSNQIKAEFEIEQIYSDTGTIGGYQHSWSLHKPTIPTYKSGSCFILSFDSEVSLDCDNFQNSYLGERTREGYGEFSIYPINQFFAEAKTMKEHEFSTELTNVEEIKIQIEPIIYIFKDYIRRFADNLGRKNASKETQVNPSAASRIRLMFKENKRYIDFIEAINEIKTDSVKKAARSWARTEELENQAKVLAKTFLKIAKAFPGEFSKDLSSVNEDFLIDRDFTEEIRRIYLNALLSNIKLEIRTKRLQDKQKAEQGEMYDSNK